MSFRGCVGGGVDNGNGTPITIVSGGSMARITGTIARGRAAISDGGVMTIFGGILLTEVSVDVRIS
jgi:hypothetical protein